ncbi:hypothetical protein D0Z07_0102 [Hyphodiscus hymeniophilus]|uniref:Fungal N-terminal domain-containing protein n=1 Tax=Hyphodiscus hymeniophilus TaxID=353542 RepID=A0A9P7B0Z0_9HELO|nr:hypothetical protein D0Z07_0102 [Hyphodiscus hymeniophilus]
MAEIIGVAASISGLIALAEGIYSRGYKLIKAVKDAEESIDLVLKELNSFTGILHSLRNVTTQFEDGMSNTEPTLQIAHINAYRLRLSGQTTIDPRERSLLSHRLRWPLSMKKTKDLVGELQNHKATLSLALNADSI